MNHKISVLLADDHPLFRKGLRVMLEEEGITVLDEAGGGEEAIEKAIALAPDVVVMDISMPGMDGIEATRRILKEVPSMKVLPLSIHSGKRFVENMLRAGASGYVLKESAPEDLLEAIRKVHGGDVFLSPGVSGVVLSEYMRLLNKPVGSGTEAGLTEYEEAVLRLIGEGYAVKEISVALDKSVSAVQGVRRRLMKKLGLGSETELAEYASAERWANGESQMEMHSAGGWMPILATKLYPPGLPTDFVPRQRLLDRLEEGDSVALTLVSAPAGYGKSSLLAEWMSAKKLPTVWLSLDEEDSDPGVFLTYLTAAVEALFPGACRKTRSLLRAPQLPPPRVIAGYLVNDLDAIEVSFDLVLDDYHQIRDEAIHNLLSEVFHHPSAKVHWFLLTRRDPPLPLASLRADSRMNEVRFEDLRCTPEEVAAVMGEPFDGGLEDKTFQRLCDATEGWVTGLRLAALAFAGREDPESLVAELNATPSGIQEYLTEQVLAAQPPEILDCLLKTAILDRFCAPLCEAVCRADEAPGLNGQEFITRLVSSGLFVIPVDASGTWYRFHHLFQHLLEQKLADTVATEDWAALHLRASRWFEANGLIDEALTHARKSGEPERMVEIVEPCLQDKLNTDGWPVIERWLARIPQEVLQQRPKLLFASSYVATERSQLHELPGLAARIEELVDERTVEPEVMGTLNFLRGQIQYWQGDPERSLEFLLKAKEQMPSPQGLVAGETEMYLAMARQALGRHAEAIEDLKRGDRGGESAVPIYHTRLVGAQAFVDALSGELAPAAEAARRLEGLGRKHGIAYTESWGAYLRALVQFHWFDLDAATGSFSTLVEKRYSMHSRAAVDSLAGLALTLQAGSQPDQAVTTVRRLHEFAQEYDDPQMLEVAGSCEARLAVWQGDLEPALRWQRSYREPLDIPSMILWLEVPAVTECRVLIARGTEADLRQAMGKLEVLRKGLRKLHNTCQLIDVMVLQALVFEKQDHADKALKTLGEVVKMAEPGGWIRPFAEAGATVAGMLARLETGEQTAEFVNQLRVACSGVVGAPLKGTVVKDVPAQPLIEPLTNRELDVLELLGKRLYDKEIADRLSISPGTVKSHLKHIYQKLLVGNRREAVDKATELGII